ncbi:MAG: response regulator transcription factor [Actinobacteria bacterium]|nr:response regulator transcription factor [Actinomycetota bacterium]
MNSPRILVVDDEQKIRSLVASYLTSDGFDVVEASNGEEAIAAVSRRKPDLIVMDIRMPGMDGLEALTKIRTISDVSVILLTARAEETDRIIGLSVGADDYVTKPFSPRELVARVKAVLRRNRGGSTSDARNRLEFDAVTVDLDRREVWRNKEAVDLTALQFDLLAAMAEAPGRVFTRRQLIERVWGWDFFGDERIVDAHIRNLRRALDDDAANPQVIGTVRSVGYKLVATPA